MTLPICLQELFKSSRSLSIILMIIMAGCSSTPATENNIDSTTTATPTPTNADNIYHYLLAEFAYNTNQDDTSVDALVKLSKDSRNEQLLEEGIEIALEQNNYAAANALSRRLLELSPDHKQAKLALIQTYFLSVEAIELDTLYKKIDQLDQNETAEFVTVTRLIEQREDEIIQQITDALLAKPITANRTFILSSLYARQIDTDNHLKWLKKTRELAPEWELPATLKLRSLLQQDDNSAERFAQETLAQHEDFHAFRYVYISSLIENDNLQAAKSQLESLLKAQPDYENAILMMAAINHELEDYDSAREYINQLRKRHPDDERLLFQLAEVEIDAGNTDQAIEHLNNIFSAEYYFDAQIEIARIIEQTDGLEPAINYLQKIDTVNDIQQIQLALEIEQMYSDNKAVADALQTLNQTLKRFPDNTAILYRRAFIFAIEGEVEKLERDVEKLIELDPESADSYNLLGYTLLEETDRYQEALALIEKANELSPNTGYILDSLGWAKYKLNQPEEALKYLLQAFSLQQDVEIAAHIGEVYWSIDRKSEALFFWHQASEIDPDNEYLKETFKRLAPELYEENDPPGDTI